MTDHEKQFLAIARLRYNMGPTSSHGTHPKKIEEDSIAFVALQSSERLGFADMETYSARLCNPRISGDHIAGSRRLGRLWQGRESRQDKA